MNIIIAFIVFITDLMWIDLILCFISKTFNNEIISELEKQNKRIDKRNQFIKKVFKLSK